MLSSLEEVVFNPLLGSQDHAGEEFGGDLFHRRPHLEGRVLHHVRVKYAPELIFQRHEEFRFARIALTSRPTAQLVINSSRLVSLRTQDVKSAERADFFRLLASLLVTERKRGSRSLVAAATVAGKGFAILVNAVLGDFHLAARELDQIVFHASTEQDVNTASRHVGGDGYLALSTGFGDDDGFLFVELRVEDVVGNSVGKGLQQELFVLGGKLPRIQTPRNHLVGSGVGGGTNLGQQAA